MITRSFLVAALAAFSCVAAPPLTTIQDVLYKADGTRFNGILNISWTSFEAMDKSAIATQSTTVKITEGVLNVQLVPTTSSAPPVYYRVRYNSEGRVQFEETWSVPSAGQPVRLRDVRVIQSAGATSDGSVGDVTTRTITESDVTGLIADLDARPVKGPGYMAGRVALVSSTGALETAPGLATDCVRVDGSSGPCGGPMPAFVDGDAPAGIVDGANRSFVLSSLPDPPSSLAVYRNGVLQKAGVDYATTSRNITFVAESTPQPGDILLASYRLSGSSSAAQVYAGPQVLCAGIGAATSGIDMASLGTCQIPAGLLQPGDRVELRYDLEHQGAAGGFTFETAWGSTSVTRRDANLSETLASGTASAAMKSAGAQISHQSWGAVLPLASGVLAAADDWRAGIRVDFRGKVGVAGDSVSLRGYTVVRLP